MIPKKQRIIYNKKRAKSVDFVIDGSAKPLFVPKISDLLIPGDAYCSSCPALLNSTEPLSQGPDIRSDLWRECRMELYTLHSTHSTHSTQPSHVLFCLSQFPKWVGCDHIYTKEDGTVPVNCNTRLTGNILYQIGGVLSCSSCYCSVTLRVPPLDSETVWTGDFWSKTLSHFQSIGPLGRCFLSKLKMSVRLSVCPCVCPSVPF